LDKIGLKVETCLALMYIFHSYGRLRRKAVTEDCDATLYSETILCRISSSGSDSPKRGDDANCIRVCEPLTNPYHVRQLGTISGPDIPDALMQQFDFQLSTNHKQNRASRTLATQTTTSIQWKMQHLDFQLSTKHMQIINK
jgi:hypothetical protein